VRCSSSLSERTEKRRSWGSVLSAVGARLLVRGEIEVAEAVVAPPKAQVIWLALPVGREML